MGGHMFVENLESRRLFAGSPTPTAAIVGSTLVVTGGTKVDNVQVFEDGFAQVHVQYTDSSGSHDVLTAPVAGITFATVDTAGKDDKINVDLDTINYAVNAGNGKDQIVLNGDAGGSANGQGGDDTITATSQTGGGSLNITGGDGNDKIDLTDNASGSNVDGGKGKDQITISNANNTGVQGGDDDDKIFVTSSGAAAGLLAADINGGNGNDLIAIAAGDNHVDGGAGTDTLQLIPPGTTLFGEVSIEKHI